MSTRHEYPTWRESYSWSTVFIILGTLTLGIAIGVLGFAYATASLIYEYTDSVELKNDLPTIDVIVCLAGARGRITVAADLWERYRKKSLEEGGPTPVFFVSGMGPAANWEVFTAQVPPPVLKHLQKKDVVLENVSENTVGNADIARQYLDENGWRRILLITSSYHMRRSQYIFSRTLNGAERRKSKDWERTEIETYAVSNSPFNAEEWRGDFYATRVTLLEYLKWAYYRLLH